MNLDILEHKCQLHESIEIFYSVSPQYTARFWINDGNKVIAEASGETIIEALTALQEKMKSITVRRH